MVEFGIKKITDEVCVHLWQFAFSKDFWHSILQSVKKPILCPACMSFRHLARQDLNLAHRRKNQRQLKQVCVQEN